MLSEINRRADLTDTERRIMIYLILDRANSDTGLCCATERNIADALGVTDRAVRKAKASLKAKEMLDWDTERLNGKNQICLYRFRYKVRRNTCSSSTDLGVPYQHTSTGTAVPHSTGTHVPNASGTPVPHQTGEKFYAKFESAELEAWDRHSRMKTGKALPRDRAGGWLVPSQWPPTTMSLEDLLAT